MKYHNDFGAAEHAENWGAQFIRWQYFATKLHSAR